MMNIYVLKVAANRTINNVIKKSTNSFKRIYSIRRIAITTFAYAKRKELIARRMRQGRGSFIINKRYSIAPMPYRPGYALGSVIKPTVIDSMKEEAVARSKIVNIESIMATLERTAKDIKNERARYKAAAIMDDETFDPEPYNKKIKELEDEKSSLFQQKFTAFTELLTVMQNLNKNEEGKRPTTFNSGSMSPVDWTQSTIKYLDRAYDSINVNASFHVREGTKQSMEDFASGVSVSAASKAGNIFGSGVGTATQDSMQQASNDTKDEQSAQAVLVLIASATHKKVQQFEVLEFDPEHLVKAWNMTHPDAKITKNDMKKSRYSLSQFGRLFGDQGDVTTPNDDDDNAKKLCILGECILGSCMVGMVHFVRRKQTESHQQSRIIETQHAMEASASASIFGIWLGGISGNTQIGTNNAHKLAQMFSSDQVDIKFDLMCLGYLPILHKSNLEMAVEQFKDFDPAKFMQKSAKVVAGSLSPGGIASVKDNKEATRRQSNMAAVIESTVMSIQKADSMVKTAVLDMETFMTAFDEYTKNAPKQDGVGIPIGMNVLSFSKQDIINYYIDKKLGIVKEEDEKKDADDDDGGDGGDDAQT